MSIGDSGRIVLEVDPRIKRHLYAALASDGSTLKAWFMKQADAYIAQHSFGQSSLFQESQTQALEGERSTDRMNADVAR